MTLNEWVKGGNPMFSNHTEAWLCQKLQINGRQLREMELGDIYAVPDAGEVARREHDRWRKTVYLKVVKSPTRITNLTGKGYAIATRKNTGAKGFIDDHLGRVCVYDSLEAAEREISDILNLYDGYERE